MIFPKHTAVSNFVTRLSSLLSISLICNLSAFSVCANPFTFSYNLCSWASLSLDSASPSCSLMRWKSLTTVALLLLFSTTWIVSFFKAAELFKVDSPKVPFLLYYASMFSLVATYIFSPPPPIVYKSLCNPRRSSYRSWVSNTLKFWGACLFSLSNSMWYLSLVYYRSLRHVPNCGTILPIISICSLSVSVEKNALTSFCICVSALSLPPLW